VLIWLGLGARPSPTIVIPGEATEGSDFVRRNRRCRIDGSEKLQLTSAPLSTGAGRWSPDGRQLAFLASAPGTAGRLYLVSAEETPNYVVFSCRLTAEEEPIKLGVPFRAFEEQVEERMNRIDLYKDLPRGRKRPAGKRNFWSR
jgi:hypothetical protein